MVSFLGTTNYLQCRYELDGVKSEPVRFVQEVIADQLFQEFSPEDKILIFFTEDYKDDKGNVVLTGSKTMNWEDNGQSSTKEDIEKRGLEGILKSKPYGQCVEGCPINAGFDQEGVWNIFETVYGKLQEGDRVYFDVTHAFRSIPMFSTVLFNYAQFMKGIELCRVCYGAFEKLGPTYKVRQEIPNPEDREVPILDLSSIIQLQELTNIAHDFLSYGQISGIGKRLKENATGKSVNQAGQLVRHIADFTDSIIACKLNKFESSDIIKKIRDDFSVLKKYIANIEPQRILVSEMEEKLSSFRPNGGFANYQAAVNWLLNYDVFIIQAYIVAEESLITEVCKRYKDRLSIIKQKNKDEDVQVQRRNFVSSLLGIQEAVYQNTDSLHGVLSDYKPLADELIKEKLVIELRTPYQKLSGLRNKLCHGKNADEKVEKYKKDLKDLYEICCNALAGKIAQILPETLTFVNLSNHPSSEWGEKQLQAAQEYGTLVDLPFPVVPEDADRDEVESLAEQYVQKVQTLSNPQDATIHVMGEMTFTFVLVTALKSLGYRCVASTTRRIVEYDAEGVKKVKFDFCRFREY